MFRQPAVFFTSRRVDLIAMKLYANRVDRKVNVRLSEVISALSYALDLTHGDGQGHANRSCLLGMKIAALIQLNSADRSALFYGLLLKDLGCSANASKMSYLFGADERHVKSEMLAVDWSSKIAGAKAIARLALPHAPTRSRIGRIIRTVLKAPAASREIIQLRCERGAKIAKDLLLPESTSDAIRSLDEHWDGSGHPDGLRGRDIPMLSRIICLAQAVEVFATRYGIPAAFDMVNERNGTWFDPTLVKAFRTLKDDTQFWESFSASDSKSVVTNIETEGQTLQADGDMLDRIAHGFAMVIDAKSPWTFAHSEGVAAIAAGIAQTMDLAPAQVRDMTRAGLLHDVGKLGVSNMILDKPGKLTPEEIAEMRRHTDYTYQILKEVEGFRHLASNAASHHERLDGKGYHRGLTAEQLPTAARILAVADMFEALSAKRPYRASMTQDEVLAILAKGEGTAICPEAFAGLKGYLAAGGTPSGMPPVAAAA